MNLLREYIRALLTEAAMGPADLPDDAYVVIQGHWTGGTKVYYAFEDGMRRKDAGEPWGFVHIVPNKTDLNCLGASEVVGSNASQGWGPLLYDVAMEVVGDAGLMADRMSLSKDAFNVWQVYMTRGDVQKKQLDDVGNTLTPDEEDNCGVDTAIQRSGLKTADMFSGAWNDEKTAELLKDSPVMKVYTKGPTTIGELESMGRLIRK